MLFNTLLVRWIYTQLSAIYYILPPWRRFIEREDGLYKPYFCYKIPGNLKNIW
jgi:hypothetical protein